MAEPNQPNPFAQFAQPDIPAAQEGSNPFAEFVPQELAPASPISLEQKTLGAGMRQGLMDIPEGFAQLAAHGAQAIAPENESTKTVAESIDKYIQGREGEYAKNFPGGKAPPLDIGRMVGNIVAGAPISFLMPGAAAETLGPRVASGLASGLLTGAAQPVDPSNPNFWQTKGEQAVIGAAGGGVGPALAGGAARVISPNTNPNVKLLMNEGVTPSAGQIVGGWFNDLEQKFSSIPGIGDAIKNARYRAMEDLNRAAINRSLSHIGESLGENTPVGRQAVAEMGDKISGAYDKLLPNLTWQADPQFINDIQNVHGRFSSLLPQQQLDQFNSILKDQFGKVGGNNMMPGNTYKEVESQFGRLAADFRGSANPDQRNLGQALGGVQMAMRGALRRANPQFADQLSNIDAAYADSLRVQGAAAMQGAKEGVFSPANLSSSVKALDKTLRDKAFARGEARMQDLSDAAKSTLGSTVPDSGTAGRGLAVTAGLGLLGGGGEMLHIPPSAAIPAAITGLGGIAAYTRPGQTLAKILLASRPDIAAPIASGVRRLGPAASSGLAAVLGQQAGGP